MKPTYAAFVVVAVVLRSAALVLALCGLFIPLGSLLAFLGGITASRPLALTPLVAMYLAAAAILWLGAKPLASLITRDHEAEPLEA